MDHLEDRCGRDGVAHARVRRGQLVLVAGFALAVTFVALALLLNSAIFAENLATRQTGGDAAEAEQISGSVDQALRKQLAQVNTDNTGYNYRELAIDLKTATDSWSDITNRQLATDGTTLRVSIAATTNGTRIIHADSSEEWTNRPGASDWSVFTDTPPEDVRWYRFNVSREGLLQPTLGNTLDGLFDNAFHVRISEESGPSWNVYVFRGNLLNDNVYVMAGQDADFALTDPYFNSVSDSCTVNQDRASVELWKGTVNGISCDELSFIDNITGDVTVEYRNADSFLNDQSGTYDVSLNTTAGVDEGDFYNASVSTQSPYLQSTVTQVKVERQIQRPDSVYSETTTIEPAPPEPADVTDVPMPAVSISEPDAGLSLLGLVTSSEFTVNWQARDANGDLKWVNVSVIPDPDPGSPQPPWNRSVSGTSTSGSGTYGCDEALGLIGDCPDTYTITVTATDEEGHTATATEEFEFTNDLLDILGIL